MASRSGHSYNNIYTSDASRNLFGDVYNQYGPLPDQQACRALLDSLRYDGMDDRLDRLNSAERGTFEWALAGRNTKSTADRDDTSDEDGQKDDEDNSFHNEGGERGVDSGDEAWSGDDEEDEEQTVEGDLWLSTKTVDSAFTEWLTSDEEEGNLFCFMGKPGSGKSTLM